MLITAIDCPKLLIPNLRHALRDPLPGPGAQMKMAPTGRRIDKPDGNARQSAVLALIHRSPEGLALVFTLRTPTLKHHGGQISFPGGGEEPGDRTYADTALRETREELGIPTGDVEILGSLTALYIAPSHNLVHPFVGWLPQLPTLNPNPVEVSKVLTIPLRTLLCPSTCSTFTWHRNGQTLTAPCYQTPNACIWGATAMMLSELLEILTPLVTNSRGDLQGTL